MVDTERLKSTLDLRDLAGRMVELHKETGVESSGPCPKCGGTDRFHVKAGMAFCRQCWPLEVKTPAHDAIGYTIWAGLAHDFRGAVDYLGGGLTPSATLPVAPAVKAVKIPDWQSPAWQTDARRIIDRGRACLESAAGEPGWTYLLSRGIWPDTWEAWGLGYDPAKFDPATKRHRPAIVIPWQRDRITAVKYRFLDSVGDRFTQVEGGQQIAFGLNLAGTHFATLWLVEGEFNCVSIWQALRAECCVNFDVVSFGSGSKTHLDPILTTWADKYQTVIVWADSDKDPNATAKIMSAFPGAFGLTSPKAVDGVKLDANALLQAGGLASFARAAMGEFVRSPAYVARLQAAIGDGAGPEGKGGTHD